MNSETCKSTSGMALRKKTLMCLRSVLFFLALLSLSSCSSFVMGIVNSEKVVVKISGSSNSVRYIIEERSDSQQENQTLEEKQIELDYRNKKLMDNIDWHLAEIPATIEWITSKKSSIYVKIDTAGIGSKARVQAFRSNRPILDAELKENSLMGYQIVHF